MASGDNNAFTNNDYTDFYITLPKDNLETALWLESDRMEGLDITPAKLETEKKRVIEEFRQRYLNQPYGDQPMLLRALAYKVHPYRWAAIGLTTDHIAEATLEDVEAFTAPTTVRRTPCCRSRRTSRKERMLELAEKWFAPLADRPADAAPIPQEPAQTARAARKSSATCRRRPSPWPTTWAGARTPDSTRPTWFRTCWRGGDSGRLYTHLVKERRLLVERQRLCHGRRGPGAVRLHGPAASGA